jgi:uncharacterized protein (TIGR02001 family)
LGDEGWFFTGVRLLRILAALLLLTPAAAQAQTLGVQVDLVSDYRFRGYSLSDEAPALQGSVTLESRSGFYGQVWASTIEEYGTGADGEGATVEVDFLVGRAWRVGSYNLDVGLALYTYPGGEDVNYIEFPAAVSRAVGDWTWTVGAAYAPRQDNLGDQDNTYVYGAVGLAPAAWPVALDASLGWEDGAFADHKLDWSVGVSKTFGPLTLGARYVDADDPTVGGAVVGSVGLKF